MYVYNPDKIIPERIKQAENILKKIRVKHAFIGGSFLYKRRYKDIDLFLITRTKKEIEIEGVQVSEIDFNKMHSLFYHSVTKMCVSKNILPKKDLKVTLKDYWKAINYAVPTMANERKSKNAREVLLYTEYLQTGKILDSFELHNITKKMSLKKMLSYIFQNSPNIFRKRMKKSYLFRFFYSYSGFYEDSREYDVYEFLYHFCHHIINGKSGIIQEKNTRDSLARISSSIPWFKL